MKTMTNLLFAGTLATCLTVTNPLAAAPGDAELEPCMNGGVSASGLYPTQAQEDAAIKQERKVAEEVRGGKVASK